MAEQMTRKTSKHHHPGARINKWWLFHHQTMRKCPSGESFTTNRGIPHRVSIQDSSGWMVDAVDGHMKYMGMDQYLLIPFLGG